MSLWKSTGYYPGSETENFKYEMVGKSKGIMIFEYYDSYSGYDTEYVSFEIEGKSLYTYGEDKQWVLNKQ